MLFINRDEVGALPMQSDLWLIHTQSTRGVGDILLTGG